MEIECYFYFKLKRKPKNKKVTVVAEDEVVKPFVLKHSKMSEQEYDKLDREEFYMMANDALELGFIDEIITDFEAIF